MTRGTKSEVGDTRVAPNGYKYTRTEEKWELTHRLVAEARLGRKLRYNERVRFKDKNRANLDPHNIQVFEAQEASAAKRRARIEARIDELQAQLNELEQTS